MDSRIELGIVALGGFVVGLMLQSNDDKSSDNSIKSKDKNTQTSTTDGTLNRGSEKMTLVARVAKLTISKKYPHGMVKLHYCETIERNGETIGVAYSENDIFKSFKNEKNDKWTINDPNVFQFISTHSDKKFEFEINSNDMTILGATISYE